MELAWAQATPDPDRWGFERHDGTPASAADAVLRCRARGARVVVGPLRPGLARTALDRAATADLLLVVPQAMEPPPDGWPANAVAVAPPPGSEVRAITELLIDADPADVVARLPTSGRAFVTARGFGPELAAALPGRDVWGVDGPPPPDRIGTAFPDRWGRPASALAVAGYESLRLALWLLDQDCPAEARARLLDGAAGSVRGPSAFVWSAPPDAGGVRFQASADWVAEPLQAVDGGVRMVPPQP